MLRPLDQAQRRATAVPSMSNMSISTSEFSHIYFNWYWCLPVNQQDINVVFRDNPAALVLKKKKKSQPSKIQFQYYIKPFITDL